MLFSFRVVPLVACLVAPPALAGQSLLDRSPNLSGDFVGQPGTVNFHFIHRFVRALRGQGSVPRWRVPGATYGGAWDSPSLASGTTFGRTFDQAGIFAYHCSPHPFMTGTVVVEP